MKHVIGLGFVLVVVGIVGIALAQDSGAPNAVQAGANEGEPAAPPVPCDRPMHRGEPGPRAGCLMRVLDADKDGTLSAEEIANASAALLTLDQDGDGALSDEELRPPRPPRGEKFVERLMSHDADGDGKVTAAELPERMQRLLDRADTNEDGAIDQAEAEAAAEKMKDRPRGAHGKGFHGKGHGGMGRGPRP
ncbi:MAG: hypothetical protein JSV78_11225 [Phycisphaerales bacterium]|nr:MAG: hypothetical protein JSV78_11225 [Phycisphaerales bacterium]